MKELKLFQAAARHAFKILIHKACVGFFCFKAGLYWRGLVHDLSKFHPAEFLESIRFYVPERSPVDIAKKKNEWSSAWVHHKGMNSHHYEHWVDEIDDGVRLIRMPFEDALERICDGLGASITYSWSTRDLYQKEWEWWKKNSLKKSRMHPHTRAFFHTMFKRMKNERSCQCLERVLAKFEYDQLLSDYSSIPASCPIEECVWKEPETQEEKEFWGD